MSELYELNYNKDSDEVERKLITRGIAAQLCEYAEAQLNVPRASWLPNAYGGLWTPLGVGHQYVIEYSGRDEYIKGLSK